MSYDEEVEIISEKIRAEKKTAKEIIEMLEEASMNTPYLLVTEKLKEEINKIKERYGI